MMKITKSQLKRIIKEEKARLVKEQHQPGDVVRVRTLRDDRFLEYDIELQAPISR